MSVADPHGTSSLMHSLPVFIITWVVARLATFLNPRKDSQPSGDKQNNADNEAIPAHDISASYNLGTDAGLSQLMRRAGQANRDGWPSVNGAELQVEGRVQ